MMVEKEVDAEPEKTSQPDGSRRVAPGRRTIALAFGSLVALLTAMGPVTALINGRQDRKLQEQKAHDEISLRYMDLLLRGFETPEERKATLTFLEKALSTQRPRELMLQVVKEQRAELERASLLQQEIAESAQRQQELEAELHDSALEVADLRTQLSSLEDSARSDAIERRELEAELKESESRRAAHEQELEAERERTKDLVKRLNDAKAAAGARASSEPAPATGDALARFFEESETPEAHQALLRPLDSLCRSHHGKSLIVYFGPDEPAINCIIGGEHITLDRRSLKTPRLPDQWLTELPFTGNPYFDADIACSHIDGELVPGSVTSFSALCKLDGGRGVRVDTY